MSVDVELESNTIISGNSEINSEIDIEMSTNQEIEVYIEPREYKVVGDDVYIPINFDSAPTWLTQAITDLTNIKVTDVVTNLDSMINDLTYAVQQIEVAKNQYEQSITSLNDIDSRFNSLLTTLNSNMDGLDASLKDLIATKVTSTQASVVSLNAITTAMNDTSTGSTLGSAILNLQTSITNLNNSTNTSLTSLESSINGAVDANAQAVEVINTYVGIDEAGASNGTGLLADVEILQKQNDGVIETTTGTYDVMISPENPDLAQLDVTAEPYVTWKASDVTGMDTRLSHIGDVYVKYADTANGAKEYIASYKFIRTVIDSTSPYATDTDGFTWALITDQAAQDAYELALNAYDLADGKITSYYTSTYTSMLAISNGWTAEEKLRNTGDLAVVWNDSTLDNNGTWRWNGTSWVTARDKKLIALASDVTALSTELDNGINTWASADSTLENSLITEISDEGARVESKFAYNSIVSINGVYKKSGFGLTTNYISGVGTQANPYVSEFWIDASRLKFTNSNQTGQVAPFTIDASGVTPQVTFNGKVTFSNVINTTGTGSNLLYNSAPKIGAETKGWYVWTNSGMTVNLSAGFDIWKPIGGASVAANIGGSPTIGSVFDVGQSTRIPVIVGKRYEVSAYISAHRANSSAYIAFYNSSGALISDAYGNNINYAGSSQLSNWGRSNLFAVAPANAATAIWAVRSIVTGNDPYCFVTNAFAGVAEANQTIPSNWSEGTSAGATYTSELSNDVGFTTLGAVASQGYVLPAGVANAINTNTSTVHGSKITTGSIAAAQINVTDLFSKNITYTGVITGGNVVGGGIIKSYSNNMIINLVEGSIYIA